jgi:hypothetical protein
VEFVLLFAVRVRLMMHIAGVEQFSAADRLRSAADEDAVHRYACAGWQIFGSEFVLGRNPRDQRNQSPLCSTVSPWRRSLRAMSTLSRGSS